MQKVPIGGSCPLVFAGLHEATKKATGSEAGQPVAADAAQPTASSQCDAGFRGGGPTFPLSRTDTATKASVLPPSVAVLQLALTAPLQAADHPRTGGTSRCRSRLGPGPNPVSSPSLAQPWSLSRLFHHLSFRTTYFSLFRDRLLQAPVASHRDDETTSSVAIFRGRNSDAWRGLRSCSRPTERALQE